MQIYLHITQTLNYLPLMKKTSYLLNREMAQFSMESARTRTSLNSNVRVAVYRRTFGLSLIDFATFEYICFMF